MDEHETATISLTIVPVTAGQLIETASAPSARQTGNSLLGNGWRRLRNIFSSSRNRAAYLAGVVALALTLRLIVVWFSIPDVAAATVDHNGFGCEMGWTARSIFLGQGFSSPFFPQTGPTALVPPLYPYLVSLAFRLFGLYTAQAAAAVLAFNSVCSALTILPLFFLLRRSFDERIARIAVFGWAIYPFAIFFSASSVWEYALTSLLLTSTMLVAQRIARAGYAAWAGFGLLAGITVLSNPSITTLLPCFGLIAAFKLWRINGAWLTKPLLAALVFAAVLTPWTLRNQRAMHASFFLRDGFWIEFYAGNNGDTYESNSRWEHPASNPAEMVKYQQQGEIQYAAGKQALAKAFVRSHPAFFAVACARRVLRYWTGFWSFSREYRTDQPLDLPNLPFCVFLLIFMLRGLRRGMRDDWLATLPYLIGIIVFPLPYYLSHASMDYRQPIEPIIVAMVTVGLFGTGRRTSLDPVEVRPEAELMAATV